MFRFLIVSIFALFAALAAVGVQSSTLAAANGPAAPTPDRIASDGPEQIAFVLQPVPILDAPIRAARATDHLQRGDSVTVIRVSSGGWTQAQSASGAQRLRANLHAEQRRALT